MAELTRIVRNRSSRHGTRIRRIIMHTTEGHNRPGVSDLAGLAAFFDRPETEASAHLGIDQEGNACRMVPDAEKAWTAGDANADSLNIELIGFAEWKNAFWRRAYRPGLSRAAKQVARWSPKHDIPLRFDSRDGVCGHVHVSGPGGHWDPGPGFPWKVFLLWARLWRLRLRRRQPRLQRRWRDVVMGWLRK